MDLLTRIKSLDLPVGRYVVFGSSVMEIHGIRAARDIDIVVDAALYNELKNRGWKRKWLFKRVLTCKALSSGNLEAFTNLYWKDYRRDTQDLIQNAEMIEGVPFMNLTDYLEYKRHLPRQKDINDVKLMETFLSAKS